MHHAVIIGLYIGSVCVGLNCPYIVRPNVCLHLKQKKPLPWVRSGAKVKGLRSVHSIEASQETGQIYNITQKARSNQWAGFLAFWLGCSNGRRNPLAARLSYAV